MDKFLFLPDIVAKGKHSIKRGPFGSALKKQFFVKSGFKVYEQKNAIKNDFFIGEYFIDEAKFEELKGFQILPGDIIISCSGTIGKIAVAPHNIHAGIINQALLKITLNNDVALTSYFKYWFENYVLQGDLSSIGAAIKNIVSVKDLKLIPIPFPKSIEIQKQIVSKLDFLFENIDKSIAILEENLTLSQALILSILDEEFSMLNCKYVSINSLVEKTTNLNPIIEFQNEEFTYIDITSVNNSTYKIETPKTLIGKNAPSRAKKIVELGDIVFATTRPNLKNIAIVSENYNNPIASTGFCVLRTKKSKLFNEYLFYFLTSQKVQELIVPFIKGAQYPAISDKDLLSIDIPLPNTIEEQKETVKKIKFLTDKTNDLINEIQIKIDNMKALKSSLLDQAFKGEL